MNRKLCKFDVRWQRNFRLRLRLIQYARLKPQTLPCPRVVNNNGCIRGVWTRFLRKVNAKHPTGLGAPQQT